jgi:hypothetical protein
MRRVEDAGCVVPIIDAAEDWSGPLVAAELLN